MVYWKVSAENISARNILPEIPLEISVEKKNSLLDTLSTGCWKASAGKNFHQKHSAGNSTRNGVSVDKKISLLATPK